jgi:hypothetical protein
MFDRTALVPSRRYHRLVKLDIPEDDIPLLVRALEHYAAYLEATKRPDERYLALAEELKRKKPAAEVAKPEKPAKRRA